MDSIPTCGYGVNQYLNAKIKHEKKAQSRTMWQAGRWYLGARSLWGIK